MAFLPHMMDDVRAPNWEYLPCSAITPKIGMAMTMSSGKLAIATGTTKPEYVCMATYAGAVTAGTKVPVIRVSRDIIFETSFSATATSINIGDKVKSDFQSQYDVSEGTFSDENLQETMLRFVHTMVHPDDRKMLEDIFADDEIKRRLAHKKSFTVVFRRDYDGEYKYTEMLVAKVEAHDEPPVNIAVGFVENDEEVRAAMDRKKIAERDMAVISGLSDDFGCVVYVNSTTGKEIRYRLNAMFLKQIPQWMEIDNFWERLKAAGENIVHPEDRDSFFEMVSKERIEAALSQEKIYFVKF